MTKDYFIFDLETGGLNPKTSAIISIGAVILDGETLEKKFQYYTVVKDHPDKIISEDALKVNGFTLDEIEKSGIPIDDALNVVKVLMNGHTIVAQNAAFDVAFLNERGFKIEYAIDTMLQSRRKWPGASARLGDICTRLGIEVNNAHNAIADANMTGMVLKEFKQMNPNIKEEKIVFRF